MNIQHSCRQDDWMTPLYIIEMVRKVLGEIDLDPATTEFANKERIKAKKFFTAQDDGLSKLWGDFDKPVSVYLNPPGGKLGNQSKTVLFWKHLMEIHNLDGLKHAIFMAFSIEALQSTQNRGCFSIGEFPCCIPAKRIKFDSTGPVAKMAPSHSNVIVYVPGTIDKTEDFKRVFSKIGLVR